jgi:hypothetical protein
MFGPRGGAGANSSRRTTVAVIARAQATSKPVAALET